MSQEDQVIELDPIVIGPDDEAKPDLRQQRLTEYLAKWDASPEGRFDLLRRRMINRRIQEISKTFLPEEIEWIIAGLMDAIRQENRQPGRPKGLVVNGETLRSLREQARMSQKELASEARRELGASVTFSDKTIARYERSEPAKSEYLDAIASALSRRLNQEIRPESLLY